MKFKPEIASRLEKEWNDIKLVPLVRAIVEDAAQHALVKWKRDFMVPSIHRTSEEDAALNASGIHVEWRAIDVRIRDQSPQSVDDVANYINNKYVYDPARPSLKVCFKEPHGSGVHAHFQVHPKTRLR